MSALGGNQAERSASDHPSGKVSLGAGRFSNGVPDADRHPPDAFRGNLGGGVTGLSPGSGGRAGARAAEGARLRSLPVCCDGFTFSSGGDGKLPEGLE